MSNTLKQHRTAAGRSLKSVATEAGIDSTYLWRIERGESLPRIGTARRIAGALGVGLSDLWPVEQTTPAA